MNMRSLINLLEDIERPYPEWLDHLSDAVEAAQVGFFYEEGGCWGMALALHEALPGSTIAVLFHNDHPSHAMVHYNNLYFDWSGPHSSNGLGTPRPVSVADLERIAEQCECSIDSDADDARSMIRNAMELAGS